MRPRVFIGSSYEAIDVAKALQTFLSDESNYPPGGVEYGTPDVKVWKDAGIFPVSMTTQTSLVKATLEYDFAAMIFSGDDILTAKKAKKPAPRDNVVFEAGLFAGTLGFDRMFVVTPRKADVRIPSDLAGFTHTRYDQIDGGKVDISEAGRAIISAIRTHGVMWHDKIEPSIRQLVQHARSAYNIPHDMFRDYLEGWFARNVELSQQWPKGAMTIESDSAPWLANVYSQAQRNIFSTTIPTFMPIWRDDVGKQLLAAQVESGKLSTRIFVFPDKKSVTADDRETMKEHSAAGITVKMFFDRAVSSFDWNPSNIETDFTFIDDGEVIGVTEETMKRYRSRWYFKNPTKKTEYGKHKKSLLQFSVPL